jgi:ketosteroid isomerase-like protein
MPIELRPPLSTYFEAANAHDAAAVAALFGEDALVHDENADHRGRRAIREWAQGTYDQYDVRLTPREACREGSATFVTTGVVGTFPGSPIELNFRFRVDGDRIEELRIG